MKDGFIVGVEVLVCWQYLIVGFFLLGVFIEVVEECGFIVEIGDWVLCRVCNQVVSWCVVGFEILVVVNVLVMQFDCEGFF